MAFINKSMTPEVLESFVNDYLKEDLRELENQLTTRNDEAMEFIQLKNMIEVIKENFPNGFKTQVDIGANIFVESKVEDTEKILLNIGAGIYVEFTLEEAITFSKFKTNIINKEIAVIRDEIIKKKANINLAYICIGQNNKLLNEI